MCNVGINGEEGSFDAKIDGTVGFALDYGIFDKYLREDNERLRKAGIPWAQQYKTPEWICKGLEQKAKEMTPIAK